MEKRLKIESKLEYMDQVTSFITDELKVHKLAMKIIMQVDLASEEVFTNIAHYAYGQKDLEGRIIPDSGTGPVEIIVDIDNKCVTLTFIDEGTEFDPLKKKDPDITLSAEEREIGGLGIYMVKKIMDDVFYRYESGKNILTLIKRGDR